MQGWHFYNQLHEEFKQWLTRLGYAETTITGSARRLEYFLNWLLNNKLNKLESIAPEHLKQYQKHLETKPSRSGGSLSSSTIQAYISNLKLFDEFLSSYHYPTIVKTRLTVTPSLENLRTILTKEEITAIYKATDKSAQGYKDRAILAVYYGCGLRSTEGRELQLGDVDFNRGLLQVKKGKNYRQRYGPMNEKVQQDLKEWMNHARPLIIKQDSNHVLIHAKGKHKEGSGFNDRLKKLAESAGITKDVSLHCLRHSIATHLLQEGMELEQIRQFLGHHSLEVTQRYARILEEDGKVQ
jgi:integrase/recombinase XerD